MQSPEPVVNCQLLQVATAMVIERPDGKLDIYVQYLDTNSEYGALPSHNTSSVIP